MLTRRAFLTLASLPALLPLLAACAGRAGEASPAGTEPTPEPPPVAEPPQAPPPVESEPSLPPSSPPAATSYGLTVPRRAAPVGEAGAAVASIAAMAADLYGRVAEAGAANLAFSPASIVLALGMTRSGAAATTASEMDAVLHATDAVALHRSLNALSSALESRSGEIPWGDGTVSLELAIANALWAQQGPTWKREFLDLLAAEYGAGLTAVDFGAAPEVARAAINAWVGERTKGRIPELIAQGMIDPLIRLVLVNAVYLKAPWQFPFPVEATAEQQFTALDGGQRRVPTMRLQESVGYAAGTGWQAVELPYADGRLSMLIVLPDAGRLAAVEAGLADGLLDAAAAALAPTLVTLSLPRFDVETRVELSDALAALGMSTAFSDQADFSGMTADERLRIGFVIHQANVTVDEAGTEAAAATAVGARATSAPANLVELAVDRPFLFALRDVETAAVLFLGRVGDPLATR